MLQTLETEMKFTPAIEAETQPIYDKVRNVIPEVEWQSFAPYIYAINQLKKEKGAIILAHNYQTPEIFHGVADIVGDSLKLAIEASRVEADIILQCGVHFMAETSKLLNPDKTVLIPDMSAGCSLAESITGKDVRLLKNAYPDVPIVTYVNTSAEVKAESDVCCTSSNAVKIVERLGVPKVLCIPDEYLAKNIAAETDVEVIAWKGRCEVHERFTAQELRSFRSSNSGLKIIAHPECSPEVIAESDFAGSTAAMIDWVQLQQPAKVLMVTECSMSDNVAVNNPNIEFVRPCNLCPHMKKITLQKIYSSLLNMKEEITIEPALVPNARLAIERMIELSS